MKEQIQPPKGAPLFDPWSPEFIANPYASYHLLRETEPMHYMPLGLVASRHADITTILRDKRFGEDFIGRMTRRAGPQILEEPIYRSMSRWMLQLDPPDHGRLRSLVVRAFSARRIEDMRPRIQAIVDGIIVEPRGHMDLIADFAVICDMLGIPDEHREFFHAGSRTGGRLLDLGHRQAVQ
jgi:cytochrome P450